MDVQEERRSIVAHIESYELQIRLTEAQLAQLRRMNPRARGVASGFAQDERTLEGHRVGLAERRARLAELDGLEAEAPTAEVAVLRAVDALRAEPDRGDGGERDREPAEAEPVTWGEHVRRQFREGVWAALAEETPF